MLTSRERLRRCYYHEPLDRPGVYCRPYFPGDDPSYDRLKAYLDEHTEIKARFDSRTVESRYPMEQYREAYSDDFARQVRVLRTPAGDLRETLLVGLKGQPGLHETYFLKDRGDAEKYLSLPRPAFNADVSKFFECDARIGERGIPDADLGDNPAGHIVGLFGSETFAMMSITDRDVLHALCRREQQIMCERVKHLLSLGVGPYFSMEGEEYLVPPMHSPADFDDFNARYDQPIIDLIHDAGGRIHVHCHGNVRQALPSFARLGVDVLHPFEGPPLTDLTPREAKAMAGNRLCLEGNIQIANMYEHTPPQIREETEALIADCFADGQGLIVSPTASAYIFGAGDRCFAQYQAMIDAVLAWRS